MARCTSTREHEGETLRCHHATSRHEGAHKARGWMWTDTITYTVES